MSFVDLALKDLTGRFSGIGNALANGDGLCYLEQGGLKGIKVNEAVGNRIVCNETVKLRPGTELFRNYDHRFNIRLDKVKSVRKIRIKIKAWTADRCLCPARLHKA